MNRKCEKRKTPQWILSLFLFCFIILAVLQGQSMIGLFSDLIQRVGMNGILVLALLPGILCGIGLNFGLAIGMLCGLLAGCLSIEWNLKGWACFAAAIGCSIIFSVISGIFYGKLLNHLEGSEMTVSTYVGFSAVSFLSIGWTLLPFHNPEMIWAIGGTGLRTTISLTGHFEKILDQSLSVSILGTSVAMGGLVFFLLFCFLIWIFFRTKEGHTMQAAGENAAFAKAIGIDVNRQRMLGTILSTVLGGIGILVYSQSYGFMQLYQAPLMMPFSAVAAILIGGATIKKATITNVIIGVVLLQLLMSISVPVINKILPNSSLGEPVRVLISYGIILYALIGAGGNENE